MPCELVKIDILTAAVPLFSRTGRVDGIGGLGRWRGQVVWGPPKHQSPRDSKICGKIQMYIKKSYFLGSKYFKLKHIKGNLINYSDLLLNVVISVRDGH
jgi:hypothetical protein